MTVMRYARLATNTVYALAWNTGRLGAQALVVVLAARLLGPEQYGLFVGAAGLATTAGCLSGLGMGLLMLQEASRDERSLGRYWHKATVMTLSTGAALVVALMIVAPSFLKFDDIRALLAILVAELIFFPILTNATFAFASRERIGWSSGLATGMGIARLTAVGVLFAGWLPATLFHYAVLHLAASVAMAVFSWAAVRQALKPGTAAFSIDWRELRESLGFCIAWGTGNALGALDKSFALRIGGPVMAGIYGPAHRIAWLLTMPVESLATAVAPRIFKDAHHPDVSGKLVPRLFLLVSAYGIVAGAACWHAATLMPWLLGPDYAASVEATQWLSLFVPFAALRLIASDILLASGAKHVRTGLEIAGLCLLLGWATICIPRWGVMGMVSGVIFMEFALAASMWNYIVARHRRSNR